MFLRWLHKSWKYFWTVLLSVLVVVLIIAGGVLGILQMQTTKGYLADWVEEDFRSNYHAELNIGQLDGLIPFRFKLRDVIVTTGSKADSLQPDTLAQVKRVNASLDVWSLFQNTISITGFSVTAPKVKFLADSQGGYTLLESLRRTPSTSTKQQREEDNNSWISHIEIVAPQLVINDGELYIEKFYGNNRNLNLPEPLLLRNINSRMFLEISETQLFWDIENLEADLPQIKAERIKVTGQVYNDTRFLEFNAFNLSAGSSRLKINGEIDGVNLYQKALSQQLRNALYDIDISSDKIHLDDFSDVIRGLPAIPEPMKFTIRSEGIVDSLWIDEFSMGVGESYFSIDGLFRNLSHPDRLHYQFNMADVALRKGDVEIFTGTLNEKQFDLLEKLRFAGKANGSADSINVDLNLESPNGNLILTGATQLRRPYQYTSSLSGKRLNLAVLMGAGIDTTSLNVDASLKGTGITLDDAVLEFTAAAYESMVNGIPIENMEINSSLVSGFLEQEYTYKSGDQYVQGTGWMEFSSREPKIAFKGNAQNINIADYTANRSLPSSSLNFNYNIELQGSEPNRISGRANLDVRESVINGESVPGHQMYMDLDSPELDKRTFRLTSSLFDLQVTGTIVPGNIINQYKYWRGYLSRRFTKEVLLDSLPEPPISQRNIESLILEGEFKAKDLSFVTTYFPLVPAIKSDAEFNFNVNADSDKLLLSAEAGADSLLYGETDVRDLSSQLTASFRSSQTFKEFLNVDFKTNAAQLNTDILDLDSLAVNMAFRNDSLSLQQEIGQVGNNANMRMSLQSVLSDTTLKIRVSDFFLGNESYAWQSEGTPTLTYDRSDELQFNEFSFTNQNEFIQIKGSFSADREDSVRYHIQNVSLNRISDLIAGTINFSGKLNGTLITRSLTNRPSVQGQLTVNKLSIQNRMIGDAAFRSRYDPDRQRFNTRLRVITDSTKYGNYLDSNDDIGQDILLEGYFVPPDPDVRQDTLYYFDANFNEIDMWVIPLIADNIFESMEGRASGQGYLTGNLEDFDFHTDFQVSNVYAKPRFLKTNYFLNGHVAVDREKGVVIDSVDVTDTQGGRGKLWGTVDLNDFKPITFLDLNLSLDRLQFLNNEFGPDVPFYGTVSGTGQVKLSGANTDLFLQTVNPITVTEDSRIAIPLIEETELNENSKFIQFVENFDITRTDRLNLTSEQLRQSDVANDILQQAIGELTFSERFNLDLQFNAPSNVNVELVFDPVTGEVLTARGTGQLRITLQDEEVQMFGRYNISGGSYKFVSGEIITRRLDLESGGTIVWEGDPGNARLNIKAVYHARPNIAMLSASGPESPAENKNSERVPVDLIIEIAGTVSSVENNYYFRLSNSLDLSSHSTLSFAINQINRDEQQKFLQATSILLTGEFIPSESYDQATTSLSQSLTKGSTVINPLISNQVISPLLSNQINSLLNSDVSRFDIDFNLNAYNQIDLGIALRLYNDRLILRRDGQLTGGGQEDSFGEKIGDLNATYRINRALSVTAFHRQDQALDNLTTGSRAGDVTPSVDGIGLEAQVQFNTWQELKRRVKNMFQKLFGITENEEKKLASDESNNKKKNS